jgi:dinuclear metal center YbgI/SA1388 family protein
MEYDNSGLLVGSPRQQVTGVLTCLDVTQEVVDEALSHQLNMIVAHHPIIFQKLARINPDDATGNILYTLIRNNILIYAAHTNLDAAMNGVSYVLAETLGLSDLSFLAPESETTGFGVVGTLSEPMSADAFHAHVASSLGAKHIRSSGSAQHISRVAVCGGSGAGLIGAAKAAGAQAYVTADIKYHDFFHGTEEFFLVDAGHYETEFPAVDRMRERLSGAFPELPVRATSCVTNPLQTHPSIIDSKPTASV